MTPIASKAEDTPDLNPEAVVAPDKTAATTDKPADECLTAPNGAASPGQRWFYRIDHGTQRHCWYLRDKPERISQPVAPGTAPAARSRLIAAPPSHQSADARAEFPAARGRAENDGAVAKTRSLPASAAPAADRAGTLTDEDVRPAPAMSRAMQPLDMFSAPPPSPDSPAAGSNEAVADTSASAAIPAIAAPLVTPEANAGADSAPPKTSLQKLLMVIFGALAFAGITASLTHRFAHLWRKRRARLRRRMLWQSAKLARARSAPSPSPDRTVVNQPRPEARQPQDDAQGQIEELLSRIARRVKRPEPAVAKSQAAAAARGRRSSARRGARA